MSDTLSVEALKEAQSDLGLCDVHLVHVGNDGFTIAHTDAERASGTPLHGCCLHRWLGELGRAPVDPAVYVVTPHEPDAYSEPYGADPWDFVRVESWPG